MKASSSSIGMSVSWCMHMVVRRLGGALNTRIAAQEEVVLRGVGHRVVHKGACKRWSVFLSHGHDQLSWVGTHFGCDMHVPHWKSDS